MANRKMALPDPEEEALCSLVSTICSNCVILGTAGKDDILNAVRRYKDNYPSLTKAMVQGGIFMARRLPPPPASTTEADDGAELPDPEEEAFSALLSTICSNCVIQGITGREDIQSVVQKYEERYPLLTTDMVQGGIFMARRSRHIMNPQRGGNDDLEGNGSSVEVAGNRRRQREVRADSAKKARRRSGNQPTTAITVSVSRKEVENLLALQFGDDGQLTRIDWGEHGVQRGKKAIFLKTKFRDVIPNQFAFKCDRYSIFQIGAKSGKSPGMRGGKEKGHSFDVFFEGGCIGIKDGCHTRYKAGFEREQLQLLADPQCNSIEMKLILAGVCCHPQGQTYSMEKYKQSSITDEEVQAQGREEPWLDQGGEGECGDAFE